MNEELMIWFAQAVGHSLWQGIAIGAVAWLLIRCLHKSPARQHTVLCGALLLMAICLPVNLAVLTPEWGLSSGDPGGATTLAGQPPALEVSPVVEDGKESALLPPLPMQAAPSEGNPEVAASPADGPIDWKGAAPWVVGLYFIGLMAMLARLTMACHGSRRLRRRNEPVTEQRWQDSFQRVVRRLGLKTKPALVWSSEVAVPVLVGVIKPMVLLPVALANRLSMEQAEAVLAHELAHLQRHDPWVLAIQRGVETVLFYHPVVWWLGRELGRTREHACDDMVIASGSRPADYAETLVLCSELRLAGAGLREGPAVQLAATGSKGTSLRQRVMRVLGQDDSIRPGRSGWVLAALFAAALVMTGVSLIPEAEAKKPTESDEPAGELPPLPPSPTDDSPSIFGSTGEHHIKVLTTRVHQVTIGDTLTSIARTNGTTVEKLLQLNPGVTGELLRVGQVLKVSDVPIANPAGGPAILMEMLLAEVVEDYKVNEKSMRKEVLSKSGTLVSEPKLIVHSGLTGRVETSKQAEFGHPNNPRMIDYAIEVTPRLVREEVSYALKVTRSEGVEDGVKLLVVADLRLKGALGQWRPFEVGALIGGSKIVGSVRFSRARGGQVLHDPREFHLLPSGKVRWKGKEYRIDGLKRLVPRQNGEAVIRAARNTPYHAVVSLVDVLNPLYRQGSALFGRGPCSSTPGRGRSPRGDQGANRRVPIGIDSAAARTEGALRSVHRAPSEDQEIEDSNRDRAVLPRGPDRRSKYAGRGGPEERANQGSPVGSAGHGANARAAANALHRSSEGCCPPVISSQCCRIEGTTSSRITTTKGPKAPTSKLCYNALT